MVELFEKGNGWLDQSGTVWEIEDRFGNEFVHINENGNSTISPAVLKEFRKLTEMTAV
jgi:hypothetical protein